MSWIRALAIAAGALFLAPFVYPVLPPGGALLVLVAVSGCLWALALGILPRLRPRDAYDLGELRRVHEEARDEEEPMGEPENVVCLRCMTEYPYRLGACPRCGLSR